MYEIFLVVMKLLGAALLMPAVVAVAVNFRQQTASLSVGNQEALYLGMIVYVLLHLFIMIPRAVYNFGQNIFSFPFKFQNMVSRAISLFFPFYMILCLAGLYVVNEIYRAKDSIPYFLFVIGFSFAMHVILTAEDLKKEDASGIKSNYVFLILAAFIANAFLLLYGLSEIFRSVSFFTFYKGVIYKISIIYGTAFSQLF